MSISVKTFKATNSPLYSHLYTFDWEPSPHFSIIFNLVSSNLGILFSTSINSITSAILTAGSTSASIPAILTASGGVGLYAVLSGAQYAAAAYLYLMFSDDNAVVGAPRTYCNTCWSAAIEWLNDPRSRYINNGTEYRIMLLGANHSF